MLYFFMGIIVMGIIVALAFCVFFVMKKVNQTESRYSQLNNGRKVKTFHSSSSNRGSSTNQQILTADF